MQMQSEGWFVGSESVPPTDTIEQHRDWRCGQAFVGGAGVEECQGGQDPEPQVGLGPCQGRGPLRPPKHPGQ